MGKFFSILVPYYNEGEEVIKNLLDSIVPPKVLLGTDETEHLFTGNAPGRLIKVPAGSVNTYKKASGWSVYADSIVAQ